MDASGLPEHPIHAHNPGDTALDRRDFLACSGIGLGGLMLPSLFTRAIAAEELATTIDVARKKMLADAALAAARESGAHPTCRPFAARCSAAVFSIAKHTRWARRRGDRRSVWLDKFPLLKCRKLRHTKHFHNVAR